MTTPASKSADSPSASERLAMAMGRPAPAPLSEEERAEFERAQDRADEEAARIYRQRGQAVA